MLVFYAFLFFNQVQKSFLFFFIHKSMFLTSKVHVLHGVNLESLERSFHLRQQMYCK